MNNNPNPTQHIAGIEEKNKDTQPVGIVSQDIQNLDPKLNEKLNVKPPQIMPSKRLLITLAVIVVTIILLIFLLHNYNF